MCQLRRSNARFLFFKSKIGWSVGLRNIGNLTLLAPLAAFCTRLVALAQIPNKISHAVDVSQLQVQANCRSSWVSPNDNVRVVSANRSLEPVTLIPAHFPRQKPFGCPLTDQQNPASSDFHPWLPLEEMVPNECY
jgi:hypothetical protein